MTSGWRCHALLCCNGSGHVGHALNPSTGFLHVGLLHRHGPCISAVEQGFRSDGHNLATIALSLTNALCKQRMVFAQVAAHHQHTLEPSQAGDGCAQIAHTFSFGKLGIAQAVINVVRTQRAHQGAGQMQFFECAVWADQRTDAAGTMVFADLIQAIGHIFQSSLPVDFFPLTALLDHGRAQTVGTVQGFVGEAIAIGNPALVDVFVFQRHHAEHFIVLHLNHQVGT